MRRAFAISTVVAMSVAACACGGSDEATSTTAPTTNISPVALHECKKGDHVTNSGYNWGARISGISCDQVGRFIRRRIFPLAQKIGWSVRRGHTIHFQTAGHVCDASKNTADPSIGGSKVVCTHGDQRFAFYWTP